MNRNSPLYVMAFMGGLCAVFGSGVALVHYATRERLVANERLQHNRVVCQAFELPVAGRAPADYARAMAASLERAMVADSVSQRLIYRRRDEPGGWVGFSISGMGFWDRIDGFITLDADRRSIRRLRFFDHKETPGLGARIEEAGFLDQFNGLIIAWDASPERRVVIGRSADATLANRVDAITGATQTSTALMAFLNQELERIRKLDLDRLDFEPVPEQE